jgi:hypothetical protein
MKALKALELQPLGKQVAWMVALLLLFYVAIDYASYNNMTIFTYLIFLIGLILLLIRITWGLYYYVIVSILSDDTPRVLSLVETGNFSSVHFTTLGPFTLMVYWTLFMLFVLLLYYFTKQRSFKLQRMDKYMFGLISLFLVAGAIGAGNLVQFPRIYMQDASYVVNMAIFYFFIRIAIKERSELKKIVSLIILGYGVKTFVALPYFYLGIGTPAGQNVKVIFESGRNLMGLIFFLCLALWVYFPRMRWQYKALLSIFGLTSLFNLITYASRGNILLFGISFLLFIIFTGHGKLGKMLKARARTIISVGLIVGLSVGSVSIMRPGALRYVEWKMRSLLYVNTETQHPSSVAVRILEGENIVHYLLKNGNILWGEGLGGWFSDTYKPYAYLLIGGSAYPDSHIKMGKLFKPHGIQFVILLKMGFIGLFVYSLIMLLLFKETYVIFRRTESRFWKAVALAILVSLPFLFYKNFTSKLQVFFGITLAIVANIQALGIRNATTVYAKSWVKAPDRALPQQEI